MKYTISASVACLAALGLVACAQQTQLTGNTPKRETSKVLTGKNALDGWQTDAPGIRRKITVADLPQPYATPHVDNGPKLVARPQGAMPQVPDGFEVNEMATGLENPRVVVAAPNGDLFIAESNSNKITVLRDADGDGKAEMKSLFADKLIKPFGIAFYPRGDTPQYVYIGNTDSVVRFPYQNGDVKATSGPEMIVPDIPGGGRLRGGGHWTRDIAFSKDNKRMFVSVGSLTNVYENPNAQEDRRAAILSYDPDGKNYKMYASGIRNAVGIATHPQTGILWCSVNERDGLGNELVPDYITQVKPDGFYGWPWYYIGGNQDPRHAGARPELKDKVIVPDVLLDSHSASLAMTFYMGETFPKEYRLNAFAGQHGSWNSSNRTGYKVIRVPVKRGKPTGEYEDFMTGFVVSDGAVWGRPVGVATGRDGSLIVTDDGSNTVWRVVYTGKKRVAQNQK